MAPKVALVTGTNSGIGLAVAVQLCEAGYATYATVRALAKADALRDAAAEAGVADLLHVIEMDVSDDASVAAGVKAVLAETGGVLDVAVANAGYGDMSPPEAANVDRLAANLDVNLYGVVRLCNAVLPTMRAAGGGRIVVTSSIVGLVGFPMMPVYVATKFALEGYIESMAASYAPIGIHFSLVEPGPVGTQLMDNAQSADGGVPAELEPVAAAYGTNMQAMMSTPQSATDCAKYFLRAVTDEVPQLRYMTHEPSVEMLAAKYTDLTGAKTAAVLRGMTQPKEDE